MCEVIINSSQSSLLKVFSELPWVIIWDGYLQTTKRTKQINRQKNKEKARETYTVRKIHISTHRKATKMQNQKP